MKFTMTDLQRKPNKVMRAVQRVGRIVVTRRGEDIATIYSVKPPPGIPSLKDHPSFGMWKNRPEMKNPTEWVRRLRRRRRFHFPARGQAAKDGAC
ncbi:MAG: type II toxin-antitoxin system prevent-host-death family antitoxin [Phycisphaerae bacterium]